MRCVECKGELKVISYIRKQIRNSNVTRERMRLECVDCGQIEVL